MAEGRSSTEAEKFLRYFEGVAGQYPGEHWRDGAELCRRWLALLSSGATQPDIDEFVARLEAEKNQGSGWLDLSMQFRRWARANGFRA
jgi:hypothetical protein